MPLKIEILRFARRGPTAVAPGLTEMTSSSSRIGGWCGSRSSHCIAQQYTGPLIRYSFDAVSDIVQCFARIAKEQPERPVIFSGTNEGTHSVGLWRAHLDLRQRLSAIGVGPNQLVMSAAGNRPAAIPLLLACLSLRAPLMPVDPAETITELMGFAERFGASAVVLAEASARTYAQQSSRLTGDLHVVHHRVEGMAYRGAALLKLTSGSSGLPKATLTAEAHLIADGAQIIEAMGIGPADTQIAAIPLSHSYGFGNLVMPLLLQGTACVLRESSLLSNCWPTREGFRPGCFPVSLTCSTTSSPILRRTGGRPACSC